MKPQPMIAVKDVPASSDWYQALLDGYSDMEPDHPHRQEFDRVLSDGEVVLLLHSWGAEPDNALDRLLADPGQAPPGHGVVLTFRCEDFEAALQRVRSLRVELIGDVEVYPDGSRFLVVRDPDGYTIVLNGPPEARP